MTTPASPASTASAAATGAPVADAPRRRSRRTADLTFIVGLVLVGIVVVLALVSFVWTPHPPTQPDAAGRLQGMSAAHPFGTDRYGRDTLTWIMLGARVTLLVGHRRRGHRHAHRSAARGARRHDAGALAVRTHHARQ